MRRQQEDQAVVLESRTGRRTMLGGLVASAALAAGGRSALAVQGTPTAGAGTEGQRVYFGWLLATTQLVAVGFDFDAPASAESAAVRAYVCDCVGLPVGMAVWFKGAVDKAMLEGNNDGVSLLSASGNEELVIRAWSDYAVTGAFSGANGVPRKFAAFRAIDGAGIYDVTLDENLVYSGTSTDGSVVQAKSDEMGHVEGSILTAAGETIPFSINTLALLPEEELSRQGLPTDFTRYAANNLQPDSYIALISPGGVFWLGRNGNVRGGQSGNNIIGLDASE